MSTPQEQPATRPGPLSVRFPERSDLLAWYVKLGGDCGASTNGAIIFALETFRDLLERGLVEPPTRGQQTA